jgi:ribonuclease HII
LSINKYLKPLKIDDSKPIVSAQHQELIKEIAEIEHQKMMRRRAEERNEAEFNFTKLLNERVREYNYLIDHKHIK